MRILVLTFHFGKTSSGNATERVVDELYRRGHQLIVLCAQDHTSNKPYDIYIANPKPLRPSRLFKAIGNFFQKELNYIFWELRAKKCGIKLVRKFVPDVLYSRGSPIASLIVGDYLKRRTDIPHIAHFADPIPPTFDWMANELERKKNIKSIQPIVGNSDRCSFVTKEMLDYQYLVLNRNAESSSSFISPNSMQKLMKLGRPSSTPFIFSFVGTFSKQRSPKLVCDAFSIFAFDKNDVELHIYGGESNMILFKELAISHPKIKVFGRTNNVLEVFKASNVLIDVDAKAKEAVFISGKLMEYLSFDRYVLLISQVGSPSRRLTQNLTSSVIKSDVCLDDIISSFQRCYDQDWKESDFFERSEINSKFGITKIVEDLEFNIQSVLEAQ